MLEINLHNESCIAEIKEAFHHKFPFLKIEFFNPLAGEQERFSTENMIHDGQDKLGDIAGMHNPGYVRINEYRTVAEVEDCFRRCFGLYIQVLRRVGNYWAVASSAGHLTLAEHNKAASFINTRT